MVQYTLAGVDLEDKEDRDDIGDKLIILSKSVQEKSIQTLLNLLVNNGDITEEAYNYYWSKFAYNE